MISTIVDRLREFVSLAILILLNPSWNTKATLALYASLGILVLLVILIITMVVMSMSGSEQPASTTPAPGTKAVDPKKPAPRQRMSPRAWLLGSASAIAVLLAVWVAAGFTTSSTDVCKSCHWPASQHASAEKDLDPHSDVTCVSCHESGSLTGKYLTDVPLRMLHLATATSARSSITGYGQVTVRACDSCHADSVAGTRTNARRGLRVSHKEPMAASATCIDCHTLAGGIVSAHNAGMSPCMRCHDGLKTSSNCKTCHEKNTASAAIPRTRSFRTTQIKQISCGGCHDEKRECDSCHGLRLPHSAEFMSHNHARAAAIDIWYNSGRVCGRCHTDTRRTCRCHSEQMGHAHGTDFWLAGGHKTAAESNCNTCHARFAYITTRSFCKDVCHSPAAIAASPR